MDYRGPKLLALICLGSVIGSAAAASGSKSLIRAMDWLAPDGYATALNSEPVTRLKMSGLNKKSIDKFIIGQTLFNTPTILGGQAAKAGISCASCHSNGRSNPYFQFPGVSGAPGTADVTHSFFSSFRGNATFDPVTIPDLTKAGKISRNPENDDLEKFVRDLIVEEFNGSEPSSASLTALAHYIRTISPPRDEGAKMKWMALGIEAHFDRAEEAFYSAEQTLNAGDTNLAILLFAGARHQIGLVYERFQGSELTNEAQRLENLGQKLGLIQTAIRNDNAKTTDLLRSWSDEFSRTKDLLDDKVELSLYNPDKLTAALGEEGL